MSRVVSNSATVDEVIRSKYELFGTPVDQIVTDATLAEEFARLVNANLPPGASVDVTWLNRRLMNLRKLGESKGGLRRLERAYHGRQTKPQRRPKPR